MKRLIAVLLLVSFAPVACYNTYYISRDELKKLEHSDKPTVVVKDIQGKNVQVNENTRLFVRSVGGKRYRLTPFNFKITQHQLVASDRDYILQLQALKDKAEIDVPSWWKNGLLIGTGVLAIAGLIVAVVMTSGSKTLGGPAK